MCKEGTHARWVSDKDLERPRARDENKAVDGIGEGQQQQQYGRDGGGLLNERDREQRDMQAERDRGFNRGDRGDRDRDFKDRDRDRDGHDRDQRQGGHKGYGGRGRGGWRGKGGRFRGRGGHDRGGH